MDWVDEELATVDLGDVRRNRRLVTLVRALSEHPTESVPQACGSLPAAKGAYRFWGSPEVKPAGIRQAHRAQTVVRCATCPRVLAVQDTTSLDFTHHPATTDLGFLDHASRSGLKVHSVFAISPQGVPLGVLHQAVWARETATLGARHQRRRKETREKESQRWLEALYATHKALGAQRVVTVADREADIYDLVRAPRPATSDLLIRAAHNRRVDHEQRYLWDAIRASPVRGRYDLTLHRRDTQRPRVARMAVRYERMVVLPPRHRRSQGLPSVPIQAVLVEEERPPKGTTPVCWLLLTTLPVGSLHEALQCVRFYSYRWLIERYHFVLKSGCRVESLQLEEAARLQRALATYCVVAWRLLWLTYEARVTPDQSCEVSFSPSEWQSLSCFLHRSPTPPPSPPTLNEMVRWIAQLGGFLGRPNDGPPGVKTIWRGLQRLRDISATWQLLHPLPDSAEDMGNA